MNVEPEFGASSAPHPAHNAGISIQIFGLDLSEPKILQLQDKTPVGSQISLAAGFSPDQQASVVQWRSKSLEDIGPNESADLSQSARFIVVESDGSLRFTLDGNRYDWPASSISVAALRKLAELPSEKRVFLERQDEPDKLLDEDEVVSLGQKGVEQFSSRLLKWELNVQGVMLTLHQPTITVREALLKAGLNPDQGWQIFLKVQGQPKTEMSLDSVVNLLTPGIEKLRVSPLDVSNGEMLQAPTRSFRMLSKDENFLDENYPGWEAIIEGGRQWLLLHKYMLPEGFSSSSVLMALEIPPNYPAMQIDMFYLLPAANLETGAHIPATDYRQDIRGMQFQRWSRHRGSGNQWNPAHDNIVSHLALVESALLKETQQ